MNRGRKWAVAVTAGILGLLLLACLTAALSPATNPGLALRFVGFTNTNSRWRAQMALTNQSGQLHFVDAWGGLMKYSGEARTPDATHQLHGPNATPCLFGLPPGTAFDFMVDLPKGTESWRISAVGFQGDRASSVLSLHSEWFAKWPNWLINPVVRVLHSRIWNRDFEVSSGILTNRPPEP